MDCEPEELQFLGVGGICREASKLILSWRRLFSQIAASLIVPLSVLFLAHIQISHYLFTQINRNEDELLHTAAGSASEHRLLNRLSSEWLYYLLFKSVYLLALLVFSLLSTAAIVYTVASACTARHGLLLSYGKVISVVPRVWRRIAHTFIFAFLILFAYNLTAVFVVVSVLLIVGDGFAGIIIVSFLALLYLAGLIWISIVWHVASVISVLEESHGAEAMRKSRDLVRGKMGIASAVFIMTNLAFFSIELAFRQLVVVGAAPAAMKIGFSATLTALMSIVVLFALVAQTVVYFVCKSFRHESIDKSALADHLEVYLGEYEPLKEKDVQMEAL